MAFYCINTEPRQEEIPENMRYIFITKDYPKPTPNDGKKKCTKEQIKQYNEMIDKQNSLKELSDKVINESKEIKNDVARTNIRVDELESISKESSKVFYDISKKNEENTRSVEAQSQMTFNINGMIEEVRLEVEDVFKSAGCSLGSLSNSMNSIENIKDKSSKIYDSNKEVIEAFTEFMNNIKNIKETISGIESISEQTSMLSLNAFIESARVSENSKRGEFEVVANQISRLSDETYDLTKDISGIISKLEEKTIMAREAIDNVMISVDEENKIIDETANKLLNMNTDIKQLEQNIEGVSDRVDKVLKLNENIGKTSKKVEKSSKVVVEKTKNAYNLNNENQEKTEKTRSLMEELVKTVEELDKYIVQ